MCGIAGLVGGVKERADAPELRTSLERMSAALMHRGPDDEGYWSDPEQAIGLAHRRLSIVDLSLAGHQPMQSACGRFVLAFNGEIYNFGALRKEIERAGVIERWRGHSDTEVLLAAFHAWGVRAAIQRCVGPFAFGLWDREERTLTLGRDRLGEKPLYYGRIGGTFAFASDLAALRRHPRWHGEIDRNSLALLLRHNYVPAPYSIFRNIFKLRPGCLLRLRSGATDPEIEPYWDAARVVAQAQSSLFDGSPDEAVDRLEALLRESLSGQMIADVPLGAFLSGGIDSSVVVSLMQAMSSQPVRTFSIGFREEGYNEAEHAKAVARHLGTEHTELYVSPQDALDVIPQLPCIYSEPFSDSSQIPTFLVSKLARQHVTVALSGDGGDELFSGYARYALADRLWSRLERIPTAIRQTGVSAVTFLSPRAWNRLAEPVLKLTPTRYRPRNVGDRLHKAADVLALESGEAVYRRLVSHWHDPCQVVLHSHEPRTMLTGLIDVPEFPDLVHRMMFYDLVSYLPDDILVKVDRASMAVGLEARVPMLDHRIVEFAWSLPLQLARRSGQAKWPLRQILYRYVPKAIIDRPKMGFGVPIDDWLRGPLRDWGETLLSETRLRTEGFFDPQSVRQAWQEHQAGTRNSQYLLWDVLMFQAWLENEPATSASGCSRHG